MLRLPEPHHSLLMAIYEGADHADALRDLTLKHAEHLRELGPVRVLALDPCPRCGGRVVASDTEARCTAGCEWSYRQHGAEPVASRRVDA